MNSPLEVKVTAEQNAVIMAALNSAFASKTLRETSEFLGLFELNPIRYISLENMFRDMHSDAIEAIERLA